PTRPRQRRSSAGRRRCLSVKASSSLFPGSRVRSTGIDSRSFDAGVVDDGPMSPGGTTVLDRLARLGVALAMGLGGSSLILSMVALSSRWLAWPIGLGAAYAIVKVAGDEYETSSRSVACAVLTVAIGITAFGIASPHEHVLGGRDAATYVATASWISREGSVLIDAHREQFDGLRDVDFESLGFRMRE